MNATVSTSSETAPVDLATMRETISILLDPEGAPAGRPVSDDEMETLTATLRGHLELMIPEVERLMAPLPKTSIDRYCILACLGEARERLRAEPSARYGGRPGHARRLARALNALCDHHEQLCGYQERLGDDQ